jgi:AraC-like DNA-binding protein
MYNHTSLPIWLNTVRTILLERGEAINNLSPLLRDGEWLQQGDVLERADVEDIADAWRLAARVCSDSAIGIHAAEQYFQPANWRTLGLAMLCSKTLRDAFERMERYGEILSNAASFHLQEERGCLVSGIDTLLGAKLVGYEAVDFGLASVIKLLRMVFPGELPIKRVELVRPPVEDIKAFKDFFGCEVIFNAERNGIFIDLQYVDIPLPGADSELAEIQDQLSARYAEQYSNSSFALKVKNEIIRNLPGGDPSQQVVAETLNCTQRNLQRKLQDEGVNFKQLLAEIRQQLARDYLQQSERSLSEVAYLLGFSDHSNFTRAFKRWFGISPTEYRQQADSADQP